MGRRLHNKRLMLGNEAIARGLMENGCAVATSYPGTPASEILAALFGFQDETPVLRHIQWAVNEKVAFEIAYTGSMTGLRSAVSMKQVGLNVASDPLMSAAYLGTEGGFIVVSADDPGPHSSQTEQDSRLMAMMAKIPVLDPKSPEQARQMVKTAFELSEQFKIPVMLRPTTRVCHARQDIEIGPVEKPVIKAEFKRNPARWAATPKFRFQLHLELEEKLKQLSVYPGTYPVLLNPGVDTRRAIVVSGVAAAHAEEILKDLNLFQTFSLFQVLQPYPLHAEFIDMLINGYDEILVIEETAAVIEMQLADRHRVKGRLTGAVPKAGELLPETVQDVIGEFAGVPKEPVERPVVAGRRPTLCAGCPHRASFFAIKRAAPKGIYTSDIGCYTLGLNLGAVDTVLCMGAAISQAAGFYHAYKGEINPPDIIATIGDSTFFHAGTAALIDAVAQRVRFVLVILDNQTTAMTGNQPTPAIMRRIDGEQCVDVELEALVKGCGVGFCRVGDPYRLDEFVGLIKAAIRYSRMQGPAVVIARHPCLIDKSLGKAVQPGTVRVEVSENCDGCGYCIRHFECPALVMNPDETVAVDSLLCSGCGVCLSVCPKKSIVELK
ncbi:MAG: thiamine pyrophosphate-dependent enzyme [Thermodesulfobacteriota bacterium]